MVAQRPAFVELRRRGLLSHKGRYELIDGLVLHRDSGSVRHDAVVRELEARLDVFFDSRATVQRDVELLLDDQDVAVTPDIVVSDPQHDRPFLVVEVSETNSRVDALEKERVYARAGVAEYRLLDLPWGILPIHSSPAHDGYGIRSCSPKGRVAMTRVARENELLLEDVLAAADPSHAP